VWHFHPHVFPRNPNDGLYGAEKLLYTPDERMELAARLRAALARPSPDLLA
jgi:histidine triad (HIT) family protein